MAKQVHKPIAIGLNKGFITTSLSAKQKKNLASRPSRRKGRLGKRTQLVRRIVQEICGFAPYEKRVIELIKAGSAKDLKKVNDHLF